MADYLQIQVRYIYFILLCQYLLVWNLWLSVYEVLARINNNKWVESVRAGIVNS